MRDVLAFAGFAQAVTLDGARQNDRRRSLVLDRRFVRGVNLARIVTAQTQSAAALRRSNGSTSFSKSRIGAKKMLAHVGAGFHDQLLIFAVHQFAHALDQQAFGVALENRIPLAAPENLDDVPARAAESRFQFLNNLAVAAHRTVETLQIAVDDKNQVVEIFARSQRDRAQRFRLVRFAVAEKRPDFRVGRRLEAAIFEIAIDSAPDKSPSAGSSPWRRSEIPRSPASARDADKKKGRRRLQFAAEILQLLRGQPPFQKRARVDSRRGVALEINRVAFEFAVYARGKND